LGAGPAGRAVAARLDRDGKKTAVFFPKLLGGTCVNPGGIPTTTGVACARAAHLARRGAEFGFAAGEVRVDMAAVKRRKDGVVRQSVDGITKWIAGLQHVELIRGHARFTGAHALAVDGRRLEADRIFINVGARAMVPDIPGIQDVPFLTNTSMMEVDRLPEHLVIIGGSYIGLEFAQMYRRFGSQVTVIESAGRLLEREDPEVSSEVQAMLEREGVKFHLSVHCAKAALGNGGSRVRVALNASGVAHEIEGTHVLAAIGRRPNTDSLGLEHAGIATDARGYISVDEQLRTSVPGIWALGDVNGRGSFTHTAYHDHQIVAANLLDGETRRVGERIPAYALFTDPPLGRVGMNEAEARASGRDVLVGMLPMTRVGRARERGETQGFMKVLVDAGSERILGASLLCIEGDEIVHSLLDAMAGDVSYKTLQRAVHIHPTVSELIPTLLGNLVPLERSA
jgi:pyruvate/2-oxoglutarate dehydrogenase complex dihydrolipoamide dehydrogenase (E3) component